jgi:hypothetical protein
MGDRLTPAEGGKTLGVGRGQLLALQLFNLVRPLGGLALSLL